MYPILLPTEWFNIYSYGLMVAIGYGIATAWILREASRDSLPVESVFDLLILQLVVGVLGARLFYIMEYGANGGFFSFEKGGLTFYGAVISSFIFDLLYLKWRRLPFWRVMDAVGFGLPLGIAIARIGCFLNGCCYGTKTSFFTGVVFPRVSPDKLHPTQLYESAACVVLFFLLQIYRKKRCVYGEVILSALAGYALLRFCVEFWRADNPLFIAGLTLSQSIGIIVFPACLWGIKSLRTKKYLSIVPENVKNAKS